MTRRALTVLLLGWAITMSEPVAARQQVPGAKEVPAEATLRGSLPLRNDIARDHGEYLIDPKVVGGQYAKPGDDPWQVALIRAVLTGPGRRPFCGGVIIADRWALTAAHCVDNGTHKSELYLQVGSGDVSQGTLRASVERILIHPDYVPGTRPQHDIALLLVDRSLLSAQSREIAMIAWADEDTLLARRHTARVTGWGAISPGGGAVRELRFAELVFYANEQCTDSVAYGNDVTEHMVCAGFASAPQDSCQGDSGGPLTVSIDGARYLVGIVSWGEGCARPGKFGVYTRVAHYADWLARCRGGAADCQTKGLPLKPLSSPLVANAGAPAKERL